MPQKSTLANKKRKKLKFDATSGSISGYLLSSSENIDINITSDNSLDKNEFSDASTKDKGRFSTGFDDSFDLFVSKKITNKSEEEEDPKIEVPNSKIIIKHPVKKSNSHENAVKKSGYFKKDSYLSIPCPFCFKIEEDISVHIGTSCVQRVCFNDSTVSTLMKLHSEYWNQRRDLGIPDFTVDENELFKTVVSKNLPKACDVDESSMDYKIPILKWNSKSKKNKYQLLRQSQINRENIITQKLAIVLMGNEKTGEENSSDMFKTVDNSVYSDQLIQFHCQEASLWQKSTLNPDEVSEDAFYIKNLAPYIVPIKKEAKTHSSTFPQEEETDELDMFAPVTDSPVKNHTDSAQVMECSHDEKSEMKDSHVAEIPSESVTSCRENQNSNRSQTHLESDWEHLFDCSDLSDVTVLFSDGSFLGHCLVFWVRSKSIFRSISSGSLEECGRLLDWKDIPSVVGKAFIKFIYCGKTQHFNEMKCDDLEVIRELCAKYDVVNLKNIISDIISSKNNIGDHLESTNSLSANRVLSSPDMFDDLYKCDSPVNFTCLNSDQTKQSRDSFDNSHNNSSKRKLDLSPDILTQADISKRLKTDLSECDGSNGRNNKDDIESVSSVDAISLNSESTMSPGMFTNVVKRPVSQCSTLPPLSENPQIEENEETLSNPPYFAEDQSGSSNIQNFENDRNETANEVLNCPAVNQSISKQPKNDVNSIKDQGLENNFYYDHAQYDCNTFEDYQFADNFNEIETTLLHSTIIEHKESSLSQSKNSSPSTPKNSSMSTLKNSIDKYFDDSIPLSFLDNLEALNKTPSSVHKSTQGSPIGQSTPAQSLNTSKNFITPSPKILISDHATPLLNYSNMISPELKGELRKYGLKPDIDRKKAKSLLRYIYELIHPIVPEEQGSKQQESTNLKDNEISDSTEVRDPSDSTMKKVNCCTENGLDSSSELLSSCDNEARENGSIDYDFECETQESVCSQEQASYQTKNELLTLVSSFIKNDAVLFESILQYVPIWLSKFHQALKDSGIKCTKNDLMDALDELCVTFRTERKAKDRQRKK